MQNLLQRTESINPHILAVLTVIIAITLNFMPAIAVVYEEISPDSSRGQEITYVESEKRIDSISECRRIEAQWDSHLTQQIFGILSEFWFSIAFLPVIFVGSRYVHFYRPPLFRFTIFIILLFLSPILFLMLFTPNVASPWNVCDYVPIIEIKYVFPALPAIIIWICNLFLCIILNHKITVDEKAISADLNDV